MLSTQFPLSFCAILKPGPHCIFVSFWQLYKYIDVSFINIFFSCSFLISTSNIFRSEDTKDEKKKEKKESRVASIFRENFLLHFFDAIANSSSNISLFVLRWLFFWFLFLPFLFAHSFSFYMTKVLYSSYSLLLCVFIHFWYINFGYELTTSFFHITYISVVFLFSFLVSSCSFFAILFTSFHCDFAILVLLFQYMCKVH